MFEQQYEIQYEEDYTFPLAGWFFTKLLRPRGKSVRTRGYDPYGGYEFTFTVLGTKVTLSSVILQTVRLSNSLGCRSFTEPMTINNRFPEESIRRETGFEFTVFSVGTWLFDKFTEYEDWQLGQQQMHESFYEPYYE